MGLQIPTVDDPRTQQALNAIANQSSPATRFLQLAEAAKRKIVAGQVSSAGAKVSGDGFTVEKVSTGKYTVTLTEEMTIEPAPVPVPFTGAFQPRTALTAISKTAFTVQFWNAAEGTAKDSAFSFMAYG